MSMENKFKLPWKHEHTENSSAIVNSEDRVVAGSVICPVSFPRDTEAAHRLIADMLILLKHMDACNDTADVFHSMLDVMPEEEANRLMDVLEEVRKHG